MSSLITALLFTLGGCTDSAAELLMTCDGGNMDACYRDGNAAANAARPRYSEARKLYQKACLPTFRGSGRPEENHPEACHALAQLVRGAKGGPKDLPRAAELFEIACRGGIKDACVDLGIAVYAPPEGSEVREEPERAVELFFSACNEVDLTDLPAEGAAPLARACEALGHAYEDGKGVEKGAKDLEKAAELYQKACDAQYAAGCVSAGLLMVRSRSKAKIEEAAALFERGCKLDARHGCFDLAKLHEEKAWSAADDELAASFYRKSCAIDPTRGCYEAAWLMEQGKVTFREGEIESLYNQACDHGHTAACTKRNLE
ncbi:MAG TPA: sel1 repeat family protein [Deltaproteobacteria bacterium]|nr:sel1 repeat family protein [Deltaproteobacteria bacterium]